MSRYHEASVRRLGFIEPRDPRFLSTIRAYERLLVDGGLMLRYRYPDGLGDTTSAFSICSFWCCCPWIWDAVRSDRPYRPAWPDQQAREHLASLAGAHLDPKVAKLFPELLASLEGPGQSGEGAPNVGESRAKTKILMVDDYQANVELLKRWLTGEGYDVLTADSGESALAAVARHHPDLVLLDIMIPEPDGFTVCQRLKHNSATSQIPIIFMSGLEPSATEIGARHLGADDYLTKPVDAYELRVRIRRVLERDRDG